MEKNMRRLCIYFFYDPDGIVDEYVVDCLHEMSIHCEKILFVSNSNLKEKPRAQLNRLKNLTITERPNTGFDVWAYKHGIDLLGWHELESYDEVVFMNFTIVGPVYPFEEMFNDMASRDIDFWGINVHSGESYDPWGILPDGVLPKHLQSHFIVVRSPMLRDSRFQEYWENMRPINSYQEAIGYHEAIFTQTFARLGFGWDSYIDTEDLEKLTSYPLMFMPVEVIKNRRCPVFKRKALLLPMQDYIGSTTGDSAISMVACLNELGYDLSKVLPNIIRTGNQQDIRQAFNAVEIIDDNPVRLPKAPSLMTVAFIDSAAKCRVFEKFLIETRFRDEFLVILAGRNKLMIEKRLSQHKNLTIKKGKYADFLKAVRDCSREYQLLGILGFASHPLGHNGLSQEDYYRYGLTALFLNKSVLWQACADLAASSLWGAYAPLAAMHVGYEDEWGGWIKHSQAVKDFLKLMGNRSNVSENKLPLSSKSGIFLAKSSALASLQWEKVFNSLGKMPSSQAEQIFNLSMPFIVQSSGFLMSNAASKSLAANYITTLSYRHSEAESPYQESSSIHPSQLYFQHDGGFSEQYKIVAVPRKLPDSDTYTLNFAIPEDGERLRFDPAEGVGVICTGVQFKINGRACAATPVNALRYDKTDIFIINDSQYIIEEAVHAGDVLSISFMRINYFSQTDFTSKNLLLAGGQYGGALQSAINDMQQYYEKRLTSGWRGMLGK